MPYPYVYNAPMMPVYTQPAPTFVAPPPAPVQQQSPPPAPPQQPDQLVNSGYTVVPSEDEVKRYPVAPGNLMTFKIENEPVIIEKSMGRSQFATPEYKYFRLEEFNKQVTDDNANSESRDDDMSFMKKSFEHIEKRLESLSDSYMELKKVLSKKQETKPVKKEDSDAI